MNLRGATRRGLTLIELVVVLVVLTAVAGILLPKLPSLLERTNSAVGSTNLKELSKSIQLYEQLNFGYPSDFDSLLDTTGQLFTGLDSNGASPVGGDLTTVDLTAEEANALVEAGITRVYNMDNADNPTNGDFSVTFNPYPAGLDSTDFTVDTTPTLASITGSAALDVFNADAAGRYVIFGVGNLSTLVGAEGTIADAPTHFSAKRDASAKDVYSRYAVVFQVAEPVGASTQALSRARLVGLAVLDGDGLETADEFVERYYDVTSSSGGN